MTAEQDLLEPCLLNQSAVPYFEMIDTAAPSVVINQIPIPVGDTPPLSFSPLSGTTYTDYYVVDISNSKEYSFTFRDFTDGDCFQKTTSWRMDFEGRLGLVNSAFNKANL